MEFGCLFCALKSFPTTCNAFVIRHLIFHQASTYVVLGFIWWACWHSPNDDADAIAGVAGRTFVLHGLMLKP
jgi:hypothetical protein